jgi:predicted nucleotidyltransferase
MTEMFKYNLNNGYSNHKGGYIMVLLDVIKKNPEVRKIFGERELVIIQKQLLGIRLTQSEKNRLSRDIRKKFEVIKELAQCSNEFGLKHGIEVKKHVEEIKEAILESKYFPEIKRIVLFGSSVDNTRTFRSDIDIAVEFISIDLKEATKFRIDMVRYVGEKTDIQVYNILPDKLKKEIDLKGRVLYERNN